MINEFWNTYVSPYIDSFTGGWEYGDDYFAEEVDYSSSFLYTVGDYAEDIWDDTGLDTAWDYAKTGYGYAKTGVKAFVEGKKALAGLYGDDGKRREINFSKPQKISGSSQYNAGQFTAGQVADGKIGQNSSGVQRGIQRMANNSDLQWVSGLVGGQAALTKRGGRTTINIDPTPSIAMRSSTRMTS